MSLQKILFIDRDGTLIVEPDDEQIDSYEKLELEPGVIPALRELLGLGYQLVMVSNQDGLGSERFPEEDFRGPHELMMRVFASQGIEFLAVHIDPTLPEDQAPTRKPAIGMLLDYLRSGELDFENSAVIGDRETDLQLAENMGLAGLRYGPGHMNWLQIVAELRDFRRVAEVRRATRETDITCRVDLDDSGTEISTGVGFLDHMLDQIASHGDFALELVCRGDTEVDDHHTVEDCALALGETVDKALGDRRGIGRYGFTLPMDESLAEVAVDLSGRPCFVFEGDFKREFVGGMATEMVPHFFRSLSQSLGAAIHITVRGENTHHMVEACFKGLGRALRPALARGAGGVPSTKGRL